MPSASPSSSLRWASGVASPTAPHHPQGASRQPPLHPVLHRRRSRTPISRYMMWKGELQGPSPLEKGLGQVMASCPSGNNRRLSLLLESRSQHMGLWSEEWHLSPREIRLWLLTLLETLSSSQEAQSPATVSMTGGPELTRVLCASPLPGPASFSG